MYHYNSNLCKMWRLSCILSGLDVIYICAGMPHFKSVGCIRCGADSRLHLRFDDTHICAGMPHFGSVDKEPQRRLETLELAGRLKVPFTTGILIGIGQSGSGFDALSYPLSSPLFFYVCVREFQRNMHAYALA